MTALHDTIAQSEIAGKEEVLADANARNGVSGDAKSAAPELQYSIASDDTARVASELRSHAASQRRLAEEWLPLSDGSAGRHEVARKLDLRAEHLERVARLVFRLTDPGEKLLERMCREHDREESAQRGEPSPWDIAPDGGDYPRFRAERLEAMRAAMTGIFLADLADAAPPQAPDASQGNGPSPNPSGDQS